MSATIARSSTARRAPSGIGPRVARAVNNGLIVAHRNIVTLTRGWRIPYPSVTRRRRASKRGRFSG